MMPEQMANGLIQTARSREAERAQQHEKRANEIIHQMDAARQAIEAEVQKLALLSQELRSHAMRNRDDLTTGYLAYSNAYTRICGALGQGLRRTASMGRVLDSAKANQEEAKQREAHEEERQRLRAQTKQVERLKLPTSEDFDLVYGAESE